MRYDDEQADPYGFGLEVSEKGFGHGGAAGTDASVTEGGLVTVYAVQLQNFPHQWEPAGKFREAAAKYYKENAGK